MAVKVLNIEACDQTISVCRTERKGKGVRVFDSFIFPTPSGTVADGLIVNPIILAEELKRQLASHGVSKIKTVIFSLSSSRIAIREVKLPPMKDKLIATAIHTNVADYFPIDLKNYHISYSILDAASTAKPYTRVLVMAIPFTMLESYFQLADRAGLNIKAIDSSGNSQFQALKKVNLKGVTIFTDVGCSSSIVSFVREGKLLLQRNFAFGADELISHYMSVSGKTKDDFLSVLHETDITHPDFAADKLLSLSEIQADLSKLVSGILRSIDYYSSSQWDAAASRVVLIGRNRHVVGLRELISEATGLETIYLDELPDFAAFTNNFPEAPSFINCIGGSLAPLDLIPKQLRPTKRLTTEDDDSSIVPGIIMCGIIVVGAILISISSWLGYASTKEDYASLQSEITSLQPAKQIYDNYLSFQDSGKSVEALTALTETPNSKLVSFLEQLEKQMPSSILILSAVYSNDGVSMNITVGSYTDAAAVISALRGFDSISQVDVSDLSISSNEVGIERVSFTANCFYGIN
ncbi:MAG: pilus assembly protein PilM, partial [Oscillospiraceae bacterium]|nr:pilus assembly protein PilM [Oscillospiraceae bacterium]